MALRDLEELLFAEVIPEIETPPPRGQSSLIPPDTHAGEVGCKYLTSCANLNQHYCARDLLKGEPFEEAAVSELTVVHTCLNGNEVCDNHQYRF